MAFCKKCGAELKIGTKFCNSCGNPITVVGNSAEYQPSPQPSFKEPILPKSMNTEFNRSQKTSLDRNKIIAWFDVNKPEPILIVVGIVFILFIGGFASLIAFSGEKKEPAIAIVPILIGLAILGIGCADYSSKMKKFKERPTDEQMDIWFSEDLEMLKKRSLKKIGFDEDDIKADPVVVTGPRMWDVAGARVKYRKGDDGTLRYTPVAVTIINLLDQQLVGYFCVLDLTTGNALNESTDEYFYRDIVSVSTKSKSMTVQVSNNKGIQLKLQMNSAEVFEVTTSGGTSMSTFIRDPSLIHMMGGGNIPTTMAEKAVAALRKLLREKKTSA